MIRLLSLYMLPTVILMLMTTAHGQDDDGAGQLQVAERTTGAPLLILSAEREARILGGVTTDPFVHRLVVQLLVNADRYLEEVPAQYRITGPRLLEESRAALAATANLALAYRLTGYEPYAERAWKEIETVLAFPDWNPSHFLDTAEMAAGVALGYDWLYDWLDPDQRRQVRAGLEEKALDPGWDEYPDGFADKYNNWNFVCNGGLLMAALVLAEQSPAHVQRLWPLIRQSLPLALEKYAPDGAWFEGPAYWKYGTTYMLLLFDSLISATGSDHGYGASPGLRETGPFFRYSVGPSGRQFNYADANDHTGTSPALFWLAGHFGQPELAAFGRSLLEDLWLRQPALGREPLQTVSRHLRDGTLVEGSGYYYDQRFFPLHLVWYAASVADKEVDLPRNRLFKGVADVGFLRSDWSKDALYVALMAGRNDVSHAQLDSGGFILESKGVRWAVDLGKDDYNLPAYFDRRPDSNRWLYFRNASKGHNVLTFDDRNQRVYAGARIEALVEHADGAYLAADLSGVYEGMAREVRRLVGYNGQGQVIFRDAFLAEDYIEEVRWAWCTEAEIGLDGDRAILESNGHRLFLQVTEPAGATFSTESPEPTFHPGEDPNAGVRLLTLRLPVPLPGETQRITVIASPTEEACLPDISGFPLAPPAIQLD